MKKILLLGCFIASHCWLSAQTLFTYGKHKVDKEEFLRAFYKNNTGDKSEKAMRDYLNLFIAFKLKVQTARDMGLDTMPDQKRELQNFRKQIEAEYLTDDSMVTALCNEAFHRSKTDICLSHIFIPFDPNYFNNTGKPTPDTEKQDTTSAYNMAMQAYSALKRGEDFATLALHYSKDSAVKSNKGDIGYINIFSLSYPIENIAYTLNDGEFSTPYKSSIGYHIIKRTGSRPAFGKMRAAQILLAYSATATPEEKHQQQKLADSLYKVVKDGGDFEVLAKQFSAERNAYITGGLMPDFGVGRYDPVFEKNVLALTNDGDITAPFETEYGMHLVKRVKHIPVNTDSSQAVDLYKTQVLQDARINVAREKFSDHVVQLVGYKKIYQHDDILWSATDSVLATSNLPGKNINAATVLFSVGNEQKVMSDWLKYINGIRSNYRNNTALPYPDLWKKFVALTANEYYNSHLEIYNTRFRNQLREFAEGNLLFDVMEIQVWGKASENKEALREYYEAYKSKYTWGTSVSAIFFTTSDKETTQKVRENISTYIHGWRTLAESSNGKIIADSARFDIAQIPGETANIKAGTLTPPVMDTAEGTASFVYIIDKYPGPAQKTFDEAKGMVINDYQALLEDKWIAALKRKYTVKVKEPVFKHLLQ